MKVRIVGKQIVSYKNKAGKQVDGISLFYVAPKDKVIGEYADNIWIGKGSDLYTKVETMDVSKPVMADVAYEMYPGARYSTLVDVKVLGV